MKNKNIKWEYKPSCRILQLEKKINNRIKKLENIFNSQIDYLTNYKQIQDILTQIEKL